MQDFELAPLHHAHDGIAKYCLSNPALARDFLEAHLPASVKEVCDFNTLAIEPASHIDEELKQSCSDILYSLQIDGEFGYIYCLVEHQSSVRREVA